MRTIIINYSQITTGNSATGGVKASKITVLTHCCNVPFCILNPASAVSLGYPSKSSVIVRRQGPGRVASV